MQKTKFLIVGQGLAGTLLSYELYLRKVPHLVVSSLKTPVASIVAAGMYNPIVFKRLTKSWMVDNLLPKMNETFSNLELLLKKRFLFKLPIAKLIHSDEKDWWNQRIKEQNLNEYFSGFRQNDFIANINKTYDFAIINQSGFVNLNKLILAYFEFLKRNKMLLIDDIAAKNIEVSTDKIQCNSIEAEQIIFCEGAPAIHNPYFPKDVFYLIKGDVLTTEIKNLSNDYILNKDIFILPKGNNTYVIGSTYHHDNLTREPHKNEENNLIQKAQSIVKCNIKVLNHRVGIRPTVKDRRPVLGFSNEFKNIGFFNGLGTKGVMLGPYFAEEMANLLCNNTSPNNEVTIDRFYK